MADKCLEFPSHTLILLALEQTNGKNLREPLKDELCELCNELIKHNIAVYMDFKPWHNGWYSEQFNQNVSFLQACGRLGHRLIEQPGNNEILYFTNHGALDELANPNSSYWYVNEKLVPNKITEKVRQVVKEYYQSKYSSAK